MDISIHTIKPPNAHVWNEYITHYSLPICSSRRYDLPQGNWQDYKERWERSWWQLKHVV